MNPSRCYWCMESPIRLERKDKEHIIERHFHRTNVENISMFYSDISVRMVFETFKAKLRAGILKGELVYPSERLIYYCPFDFGIGTFPIEHPSGIVEHRETCYVKVICATSRCSNCGRLVPKVVITMFPDGSHN